MVLDRLRTLVGRGRSLQYECRNCGTNPDGEVERCPTCGAAEIAAYEL